MVVKHSISSPKLKSTILVFFFLFLFAPVFQQKFTWIKERKLEGVENSSRIPRFSISSFLDGSFQKEFETALNINIGFRKTFVRLNNQLNYSIYNISRVGGVVVGKNEFIYVSSYIDALTGKDFRGKEYIDIQIQKAIVVQNELKKKNIDLIFTFVPGKGSFYPEYIPDQFLQNMNPDSTNYAYYINALSKTNLNVLDIKKYFLSIKDTATNILFPNPGVHWSEYASVLAADTISNYIADLRKINLRSFAISEFEKKNVIKWGDYDAANLMNVFSVVPHEELPYVKIKYAPEASYVKPDLLTIADSYYSCIEATNIPDSIYSNSNYWLYEQRISSDKNKPFDLASEIEKRDVVVVLSTDATLGQFPFNFIDEAYELYSLKNERYYELKDKEFRVFISNTLKNIETNKKWKNNMIESAKRKGISKEEEFFSNALWLYHQLEINTK